jgi:hypothetical protein
MIPEFTQAIFLRSLDEWGAFPQRFRRLPAQEQAEFLEGQGYASLHDMLAHVGVWWEEAEAIIRDTIADKNRPSRKYDFDEFNAQSLARFKDTPDDELQKWYEAERRKLTELVSSLDAEQIKIRRVQGWLDGVTLMHLKEHGVGAPRFLALDMLQREWAGAFQRFHELTEEEQKTFLARQSFPRFRDLVGHIIGWWEETLRVVDAVAKNPSYRAPDRDTDAYNAELVKLFGGMDEADVWKKYEDTRAALIELVINLSDEIYELKEVQDWIKSDVIEHYFDHSV